MQLRPRLAFTASRQKGFLISHLSGDPARYVTVDTMLSSGGSTLSFDQVDFIGSQSEKALAFHLTVGSARKDQSMQDVLTVLFSGSKTGITYPVTVRYRWNDDQLEENFSLRWERDTGVFVVGPR